MPARVSLAVVEKELHDLTAVVEGLHQVRMGGMYWSSQLMLEVAESLVDSNHLWLEMCHCQGSRKGWRAGLGRLPESGRTWTLS